MIPGKINLQKMEMAFHFGIADQEGRVKSGALYRLHKSGCWNVIDNILEYVKLIDIFMG